MADGQEKTVVGRNYFARQAATLLEFAKSIQNPDLASVLIEKASELQSKGEEMSPPPDRSPRPPDVQTGK